jgi:hypothetical protein
MERKFHTISKTTTGTTFSDSTVFENVCFQPDQTRANTAKCDFSSTLTIFALRLNEHIAS